MRKSGWNNETSLTRRCWREGNLEGELERDGDDWKMTLAKRCFGQLVRVVVALAGAQLIVVTAY